MSCVKLHENPVIGSEVFICVQTDGQSVLNNHCAKTWIYLKKYVENISQMNFKNFFHFLAFVFTHHG